jgi:hypothetical protein
MRPAALLIDGAGLLAQLDERYVFAGRHLDIDRIQDRAHRISECQRVRPGGHVAEMPWWLAGQQVG